MKTLHHLCIILSAAVTPELILLMPKFFTALRSLLFSPRVSGLTIDGCHGVYMDSNTSAPTFGPQQAASQRVLKEWSLRNKTAAQTVLI